MPTTPRRLSLLGGLASLVLTAAVMAQPSATAEEPAPPLAPQLVTVDTPTRAAKAELQRLGLDLTEHAGHDYIEIILHTAAERDALRAAGFTWDVRIPDLIRREAEINQIDDAYAATTLRSSLPSGRDRYRSLADYETELRGLAEAHPGLVRLLELPEKTLDGRTVLGVEIAIDVHALDGRPTFAMFGLHHAREWPSGEHAMEFALDLVQGKVSGDARISGLLERGRMIIVPVVNADGFHLSYTDGQTVDLRVVDGGGTAAILGTPGNAYKRKNCRVVDGQDTPDGTCAAFSATSPGGYLVGTDLNRNYGGLWGGPGASDLFADPTYRGAGPFSEPETRNVRRLISERQVTMMISNHTFSNLVLRPNGVNPTTIGPDGLPVGDAPDEEAMKALGASMTAQNGYTNQHGWELYDTTGTTEDWSYNATGGYGYTFEIGPDEFHPPFAEVVDEYVGAGAYAGKGNREAYLLAFENAVDRAHHSVITGKAPIGATLRLRKTFSTPTWSPENDFTDSLESSMVVTGKTFTWDVNPSTRPIVQSRLVKLLAEEPTRSETFTGTVTPLATADHEFVVTETDQEIMQVTLDWPTPDDLDLEVYRKEADGSLTKVGSSGNFVGEKEKVTINAPTPGTYVLRAINFASVSPTYTLTAALYDATEQTTAPLVEAYTLTCEVDGQVRQTVPVIVDRGQQVKVDLGRCAGRR
ncbi:carboxypeptidase [Nocardioides gansuensis]|uniref:Carboxypeptidase n=1 Tax=Nocardioides gansuensis TaxID=2138300 RepID=A0A2T8FFC6_9ACTN|nr:M14 family zinc carboxypeptidase [Nocardioides gansuensis]PVG84395.1 carboxypeptidase [Nocardioides gansuensis]